MPQTKTMNIPLLFEHSLADIVNVQNGIKCDIYRRGTDQSDVVPSENIRGTNVVLYNSEQFSFLVRSSKVCSNVISGVVNIYLTGWKSTEEWSEVSTFEEEVEEISTEVPCVIESGAELQMDKWRIKDQVDKVPEIIRDTYRTLRKIELTISTDPEIPERRRVRVTLTVAGKPEDVLEDERQFKEWMYSSLDLKVCELLTITYNWGR